MDVLTDAGRAFVEILYGCYKDTGLRGAAVVVQL
jgi:hypothetical protein